MASFAVSTTATRMGRVLHWLFPSRRAVVAIAAVEVAASLLGLPPQLVVEPQNFCNETRANPEREISRIAGSVERRCQRHGLALER